MENNKTNSEVSKAFEYLVSCLIGEDFKASKSTHIQIEMAIDLIKKELFKPKNRQEELKDLIEK